jgi:hypothetical protein
MVPKKIAIPAPIFIGINSSRNPVLFKRFWMPPYQARGRLLKSGMTE